MRYRSSALLLSAVVVGVLAQPVMGQTRTDPHPVTPDVREVGLAGIDKEARRSLRESGGPRGRKLAKARDLAILTAPRSADDFELLGVTWKPTATEPSLRVMVRTRAQSGGWSAWSRLKAGSAHQPDHATPDRAGRDVRGGTAPLYVGPARGVQVAVRAVDGSLPRDLRLALVEPGESASDAAVTSQQGAAARAAVQRPDIMTRSEWGADESLRDGFAGYGESIVAGVVHHTATSSDYAPEDSPGIVRSIYAYHTKNRGWTDIGYNFLVDKYGQIFEGRWGGIGKPVIGAHAYGYNTETFGVSAIGNFEKVTSTEAVRTGIEKVAAYKLGNYHRDPEGTVEYEGTRIDVLSGHRDLDATLCPGQHLYDRLPGIRSAASQRIGGDATPVQPPAGDFDDDGFDDVVLRAPGEAIGPRERAGQLAVVPGAKSGPDHSSGEGFTQRTDGVASIPERGDRFAASTAAGDFDGDGYDDLAVGVPGEILGRSAGVEKPHGAVHVFYGSAGGLTTAGSEWLGIADAGTPKDQGDRYGTALAAGDVRGGGRDDLVVGAPWGGPADDGSVVVYAGSAGGVDTSTATEYSSDDMVPADPAVADDVPDRFGAALATGDTNADGKEELLVGAPLADLSGVTDAGAVFAVPGSTDGLDAANASAFTQATSGVPGRPEQRDGFGGTLATGQLDAAHGVDLAVGVPHEGVGGNARAGMFNVVYSGADGLTGTGAEGKHQASPGVGGRPQPYDRFGGRSLAAADFDADGVDDLAVPAMKEDIGSARNSGAVLTFRGTTDGLGNDEFWHQGSSGVPGASESRDVFGISVTPGGFDGGARTDLAIGVAGENRGRGGVRVLPGGSFLLTTQGAMMLGQARPGVPNVAERGDRTRS